MTNLSGHALSVRFGAQQVLDDIDVEVPSGSVIGLIGPNGSGKSTLLRSLVRLRAPDAGWVELDGQDLWRTLSARASARRIAAVVQDPPAEFGFTVVEYVSLGRTPFKGLVSRDDDHDRSLIAAALAVVGMTPFSDRPVASLSGGERQRVVLARALVQQPQILVMDEPTNHLDIRAQLDLLAIVSGLRVTTLIALHDLNLAASVCDRLYLLDRGALAASGPPSDVLEPTLLARVFGVRADVLAHPATGRPLIAFSNHPHQQEQP